MKQTTTTLEKQIEKKIRTTLEKRGYTCIKLMLTSWPGIPDRLILEPGGKCSFIELKKPGGETSPIQDMKIDMLRQMGFTVSVADCLEDIDHLYPALHERKNTGRTSRPTFLHLG